MTLIEYLGCAMCGRSSPLSRVNLAAYQRFDPGWALMHTRQASGGPGRGNRRKGVGGFQLVPDTGKSITDMLQNPDYAEYALGVKNRVLLIVREYLRVGAIGPEELAALIENYIHNSR